MTKCNCGKKGVYTLLGRDKDGKPSYVSSCNKHSVCPSYDELRQIANDSTDALAKLIDAAEALRDFKESTEAYKSAVITLEEIAKKHKL